MVTNILAWRLNATPFEFMQSILTHKKCLTFKTTDISEPLCFFDILTGCTPKIKKQSILKNTSQVSD